MCISKQTFFFLSLTVPDNKCVKYPSVLYHHATAVGSSSFCLISDFWFLWLPLNGQKHSRNRKDKRTMMLGKLLIAVVQLMLSVPWKYPKC